MAKLKKNKMKKYLIACSVLLTFVIQFSQAQNIGIGTTTPTEKLQVIGNIKVDTLKPNTLLIKNGAAEAKVLTSDVDGNATWQPPVGLTLPYSKKVSSPISLFSINNISKGPASAIVGTADSSFSGIAIMGISATGRAGYFTSTSGKALETSGKLKFAENGEVDDAVLTSDAEGNATWKRPEKMFFKAQGFETNYYVLGAAEKILTDWKYQRFNIGNNGLLSNADGKLFVLTPGVYRVSVKIFFLLGDPEPGQDFRLNILINNAIESATHHSASGFAEFPYIPSEFVTMAASTTVQLNAQDYISFKFQNKGRSGNASAQFTGKLSEFTVEKID